jgi:adenylate kinase
MKFIVFLGLPGTGKGTQARLLKERSSAVISLSPGDVIRNRMQYDNIDLKYKSTVNSGGLLPDDFIINLVYDEIKDKVNLVSKEEMPILIFDGIPRTIEQAKMLDDLILEKFASRIACVICFNVKKRLILNRLQRRLVCSSCGISISAMKSDGVICNSCGASSFIRRKDDDDLVVRKRLVKNKENLDSMVNYYLNSGVNLIKVDGGSSQENVYKRLESVLFSNFIGAK